MYLASATLQPGESHRPWEFRIRIPVDEILGDSVPNGRYYLTASLRLNFRETPEFPAGVVELAMERQALPETRREDAVTYRAETEVADRDPTTIRTVVTATLTGAGGSRLRFSYACPVVLYLYRSRARRDAAPRSGQPEWKSREACGPELQEMWLNRGESRTFEIRANARDILGDSLPPGRYYFTAVVQEERTRIFLSSGEAELRR